MTDADDPFPRHMKLFISLKPHFNGWKINGYTANSTTFTVCRSITNLLFLLLSEDGGEVVFEKSHSINYKINQTQTPNKLWFYEKHRRPQVS